MRVAEFGCVMYTLEVTKRFSDLKKKVDIIAVENYLEPRPLTYLQLESRQGKYPIMKCEITNPSTNSNTPVAPFTNMV